MGFCWYASSVFLHVNVALLLVALLPFPTPKQWKYILKSRFCRLIANIFHLSFNQLYLMIGSGSLLLFLDSLKTYRKYSKEGEIADTKAKRDEIHIALVLAQRNYYISGSMFIVCLIFPRLISILKENADVSQRIESLKGSSKVFKELLYDMQFEMEVEKRGGMELALLKAMKTELEKISKGDDLTSGNDWDKILEMYVKRKERLGQQRPGGTQTPAQRVPPQQRLARGPFSASMPSGDFNFFSPAPPSPLRNRRFFDPIEDYF